MATITKLVSKAISKDEVAVHVVGNDISIEVSSLDTAEINVTNHISGLKRFWVDIDLLDDLIILEGESVYKFYCMAQGCIEPEKAMPSINSKRNSTEISCINPCKKCELMTMVSPTLQLKKSGVFIYADSVVYK